MSRTSSRNFHWIEVGGWTSLDDVEAATKILEFLGRHLYPTVNLW